MLSTKEAAWSPKQLFFERMCPCLCSTKTTFLRMHSLIFVAMLWRSAHVLMWAVLLQNEACEVRDKNSDYRPTSRKYSAHSDFQHWQCKKLMFSSWGCIFSSTDCIYLSRTQLLPTLLKLSLFIFIGFYIKYQMHSVPCECVKHLTILNTAV
jgi:hypothetical protein